MLLIGPYIGLNSIAQVHYNIRGGINLSALDFSENFEEIPDEFTLLPGYHIGATADIKISRLFSIETGLLYAKRGGQFDESSVIYSTPYSYKVKISTSYLEIPLKMRINIPLGDPSILFVGAGPYLGIGLNGKVNTEWNFDGQTESDEEIIEWGNNADNFEIKRLDYGLIGTLGVEVYSISVSASYWWGLANISSYTDEGSYIKNHSIHISLAYILGKKTNN